MATLAEAKAAQKKAVNDFIKITNPEKNAFFQDPSTYPLMVCLGFAICFGVGGELPRCLRLPGLRYECIERKTYLFFLSKLTPPSAFMLSPFVDAVGTKCLTTNPDVRVNRTERKTPRAGTF
jgi:hypothetical protein